MEQHLKNAIESLRKAEQEILHPCELYSDIADMITAIDTMIEDRAWEGKV